MMLVLLLVRMTRGTPAGELVWSVRLGRGGAGRFVRADAGSGAGRGHAGPRDVRMRPSGSVAPRRRDRPELRRGGRHGAGVPGVRGGVRRGSGGFGGGPGGFG